MELIERYGQEFLEENDPDSAPRAMSEIEENFSVSDALMSAFFGYDFTPNNFKDKNEDKFNPNQDYFALNGYGNFISIDNRFLDSYLNENIDEDSFIEWLDDKGYFDFDDDTIYFFD